jgi:hypothetical protein
MRRPWRLRRIFCWFVLWAPLPLHGASATHLDVESLQGVCPEPCPPITQFQEGHAYPLQVCALDSNNAQDLTYVGTVTFSSTDPQGTLPATYAFVAGEGCHDFGYTVVLRTVGTQTISATDTASAIAGSDTVTVYAAQPSSIPVTTPAGTFALLALLVASGAWLVSRS